MFVLKKYWKPLSSTITINMAHNNISIMDVWANIVLSLSFESPLPKADIMK
jgi:hypothetical protein